jgi:hypothetical protein
VVLLCDSRLIPIKSRRCATGHLISEIRDSPNAATEQIEAEQTKAVPEHLKNKHFPVNPKKVRNLSQR